MTRPASPRVELGARIVRLARLWRREADQALAQHGLSEATALPLLMLWRRGNGMRQGVLAEEIGVEGPSLVRLLDLLAAEGLVERRDDPTDRRAKTLYLTRSGEMRAKAIEAVFEQVRGELLHGIADDDLAATFRTLARIERQADGRRDRRVAE